MRHLTFDLTIRQRKRLEALAASEGKTVEQYAHDRLFPSKTVKVNDASELREEKTPKL